MSAKRAIDLWPNIDGEKEVLLKNAWHELYHFLTDEDIRGRDAIYDQERRDALNSYVRRIRGNLIGD